MRDEADLLRNSRVVYELDGMTDALVRKDVPFTMVGDEPLRADFYAPSDGMEDAPLPAIIFVSGDAAPAAMQGLKDTGQYVSWGQLAAASGCIGVTFDHRSTERFTKLHEVEGDVADLLDFVADHASEFSIDPHRVGLWVCSGGPPCALRAALSREAPH